jgi:hypothetical protein
MARDWHEVFKTWAKPPSDTEEEKGSRAAQMINGAVRSSDALKSRGFDVYATGSYRNNTNIRLGSDIDVAVVLLDAFYADYPVFSPTAEMLGHKPASYGLTEFLDDVSKALTSKFGAGGVTQGDKAFNVHENSYRLDADVSVFVEHRRYTGKMNANGTWHYLSGVEMRPRSNPARRIINWHQQHYDHGVARNTATRRRFKRITRILKRLRDEMRGQGTSDAKSAAANASSFLIESLVFNAPDTCFNLAEGSYYEDVRATISSLWNTTKDDASCADLFEVNRIKQLFASTQPWTRAQAHEFLLRAWQHVGFKK